MLRSTLSTFFRFLSLRCRLRRLTFLCVRKICRCFKITAAWRLTQHLYRKKSRHAETKNTIPASVPRAVSTDDSAPAAEGTPAVAEGAVVTVAPYTAEAAGPYPEDAPRMNPIRFTPMQVEG